MSQRTALLAGATGLVGIQVAGSQDAFRAVDYKSIAAADVAHALLHEVPTREGLHVLPSGAMRRA